MIKNGIFQQNVYLNGYKMVNSKAKTCSSIYFKGNCVLKFPNFHWEIHARKFAVNTNLRFRDIIFFRLPLVNTASFDGFNLIKKT